MQYILKTQGEREIYPSEHIINDGNGHSCVITTERLYQATDIGKEMETLKAEIECLRHTEPPKDYSVETIHNWLESLKAAPDEAAIHLLIERINIKNKTVFNIQSTLNTVLGDICCGGWI